MLIDRFLPVYDATVVCEIDVAAPPARAWAAIRAADLRDPVVTALFAMRELPVRIARLLQGVPQPPASQGRVTFNDLRTMGPGWMLLGEDPGEEFVVASIGRFWRKDYGGRPFMAEAFIPFNEPGYAKLAVSLSVRPHGEGSTIRYEARTATTDEEARRRFRRYWRLVGPGAGLVMRRALKRIQDEAESTVKEVGP